MIALLIVAAAALVMWAVWDEAVHHGYPWGELWILGGVAVLAPLTFLGVWQWT